MNVDDYLNNLPLLHTWDYGVTWNSGGFEKYHLEPLYSFLKKNLDKKSIILETGAGNSTILFLLLKIEKVITICPEIELFQRIHEFCDKNAISFENHEFIVNGSEWALPKMVSSVNVRPSIDFALIDGWHNWPIVMIDFFYINFILKKNGFLMIDDLNIHSIKEMAKFINEEDSFELVLDLGKAAIFKKVKDVQFFGEWHETPYIKKMTHKTDNPYSF